jgi:hypothetical protein
MSNRVLDSPRPKILSLSHSLVKEPLLRCSIRTLPLALGMEVARLQDPVVLAAPVIMHKYRVNAVNLT